MCCAASVCMTLRVEKFYPCHLHVHDLYTWLLCTNGHSPICEHKLQVLLEQCQVQKVLIMFIPNISSNISCGLFLIRIALSWRMSSKIPLTLLPNHNLTIDEYYQLLNLWLMLKLMIRMVSTHETVYSSIELMSCVLFLELPLFRDGDIYSSYLASCCS